MIIDQVYESNCQKCSKKYVGYLADIWNWNKGAPKSHQSWRINLAAYKLIQLFNEHNKLKSLFKREIPEWDDIYVANDILLSVYTTNHVYIEVLKNVLSLFQIHVLAI